MLAIKNRRLKNKDSFGWMIEKKGTLGLFKGANEGCYQRNQISLVCHSRCFSQNSNNLYNILLQLLLLNLTFVIIIMVLP